MQVQVISPHSFCEGVAKAMRLALKAKEEHEGSPVYLLGDLVHNESVLSELKAKGLTVISERNGPLIEALRKLPDGSIVVYSAHGHPDAYEEVSEAKGLIAYDATCRYVKDNMDAIRKALRENRDVIYLGKKGHLECEAALSLGDVKLYGNDDLSSLSSPFVSNQTTLGEAEIRKAKQDIMERFKNASFDDQRCLSTMRRQEALSEIDADCSTIVILGSASSNNTLELVELAKALRPKANVVRALGVDELKTMNVIGPKVALASGASTSPADFDLVERYLKDIR